MFKNSTFGFRDFLIAFAVVLIGAAFNYSLDRLLNVRLELYFGIGTFSPLWVADLILVPFVSGLLIASIYGLGAKIVANFAPLIVRVYSYLSIDAASLPDGVTVLPLGFWVLVTIVAVEAAAGGGLVGEFIIKKTYGRRPKHLVHKRYQAREDHVDIPVEAKGIDK